MQTNDTAPMMAATANGNFAASCSWSRQDRQRNRGQWGNRLKSVMAGEAQVKERRAIRRAEALMVAADLADERIPVLELAVPDEVHNDWASDLADLADDYEAHLAWCDEMEAFGAMLNGCLCRRCLNDDPGGCLHAEERHAAEQEALNDLADEVFYAQHDLGYGDTFDPDEIQWGFRVTDAHKAPGATSGRPRPEALPTW